LQDSKFIEKRFGKQKENQHKINQPDPEYGNNKDHKDHIDHKETVHSRENSEKIIEVTDEINNNNTFDNKFTDLDELD